MSGVAQRTVASDEDGMRLDRWFREHYPGLAFGALNKLLRKGSIRVDGGRVKSNARLEAGQVVRVPPLGEEAQMAAPPPRATPMSLEAQALADMTLFEDDKVLVLDKPFGLAIQGGPGLTKHLDGMLEALRDRQGRKPRLVHRLDRDTTGVVVVAKTKGAASALAASFRARSTCKIYWALVRGVPKPRQGRISSYLAKGEDAAGGGKERMRVAKHGDSGADHALTLYNVLDTAGQGLTWLSLRPVTGRTHQLRAHCNHIGHPIIGDPKYFDVENWNLPGGIQNRLHLHARRLVLPHPDGGRIDVTAPLPDHMAQSWNLLGFSTDGMGDDEGWDDEAAR
ncbi:MAG: RluA family pseudouridine synthase [Devosiaceae bacterium]|nr:RluA family pseudouridine synthase [Devosiaceae bacterium MH13]